MDDKMYKTDDGSALRFYWDTERNNYQSEQRGRPVHDKVLMVEIFSPGSRESSPVHTVIRQFDDETELPEQRNPEMFERYGRQIEAFLSNSSDGDMTGTPLKSVPFLDVAQIASLRESRIFTVEGLAALSDEKLRVLGLGGRTLREQAKAFLENASGGEAVAKLTSEIADVREQLKVATERAEAAEAKIAALEAAANEPAKPTKNAPKAVETNKDDGSAII